MLSADRIFLSSYVATGSHTHTLFVSDMVFRHEYSRTTDPSVVYNPGLSLPEMGWLGWLTEVGIY